MFYLFNILNKVIKNALPTLILFSLISCYPIDKCQSIKSYSDKLECEKQIEETSQNQVLSNWLSLGIIGIISYLFAIKSPAFFRFTRSYLEKVDTLVTGQSPETEPICAALNELLKLTGGYNEGIKPIFQEVRPQDKYRIKELCEFLLKEEGLLEEAKALDELAACLEENKADISDISKIREVAQQKRVFGQAVSELLKRATD